MNFVFFFPDEMSASSVSCYGNKTVNMPNFDQLAAEGVRFENCIVQNPVCSPSRCSLMTGQYVHNQGHRTLWHLLRGHEPSLFRYLKNAGYDIGWFGKNDLYSQTYLDEICCDISEKRNGYQKKPTRKTGVLNGGQNPYDLTSAEFNSFLYDPVKTDEEGLIFDPHIARAIDYLEDRQDSDTPFMLYLPISMPHPPYHALEEFHHLYDADKLVKDVIGADVATGKPSFVELIRKYRKLDQLDATFFSKIHAVYLGMNSYVDAMLGELMKTLKSTGLLKDTTIIVSSDHGDWAGNYGLVEKWPNAMDDDLVRVPLIIKTPDQQSGHVVKEQVELFDIMPTVLELADLKANHTHFAKSLVSQLKGASGDPDRAVFCEGGYDLHEPNCFEGYMGRNDPLNMPGNIYYPKLIQQQESPESVCRTTMIRTLSHKLVKRTSGENELYDLINDPRELTNLYHHDGCSGKRAELEGRMLDWYIKTSDTVPLNDDPRKFQ